jgi:leucyl-tRNA synthetase
MTKYDHQKIEKKWQDQWEKSGLYNTDENSKKPKFYVLDMFPYPSGVGLHVGHPKGYIATDIYSRMKRMQGFRVLHPMGWDAFGLPAENYAIKNKVHPSEAVSRNVVTFKKQLQMIGFSYDWEREINTTDPDYYKWTQWIFLQLFKKGLAYESEEPINWCPNCKTGLANEDLEDGKCEQCGGEIIQKPIRQWVLKITDYADRLLSDLDTVEWEEQIIEQQKNWIGRSEGAEVLFKTKDAKGAEEDIWVFTTRPDTLFGATFMVLAPEHPLVSKITHTGQKKAVDAYIAKTLKKTELQRMEEETKEKTGVDTGAKAINPVNGEEIPIYISDYVLMGYGYGAIMAVPAHDQRDWDFAVKYDLPIIEVLAGGDAKKEAFTDDGKHVNSEYLNGLGKKEAIDKVITKLSKAKCVKKAINYKMKDWVFSRQRYWGEPIPIIHCEKCGPVPVPENELPVKLPEVDNYEPTGTGESPLAGIDSWVNVKCPKCGGPGKRETNTMPQWAGSCWYYLRYIDPKNPNALVDPKKEKEWMPVDLYVGGIEHATRHLLYSRFWHKVLYDVGAVTTKEPFIKLIHVGLIAGEDGRKMSKRWGNVVNPDDVVKEFGADSMRVYEMFMGPFTMGSAWSTKGIKGSRRFIEKVWALFDKNISDKKPDIAESRLINRTVKKIGEDIEGFKFNTAISALMILVNELSDKAEIGRDTLEKLLIILAPFAPHTTEELWEKLGEKGSIHLEDWPKYEKTMLTDETCTIVVQVNGKVRANLEMSNNCTQKEVEDKALSDPNVQKYTEGKKPKKVIFVPGKILNIVI